MKDFIKKYRKNKLLTNIYTVLWAFVLAFCFNFLILDWNDFSKNLQASVLNSKVKNENVWDFYLEKNWEKIFLKNAKKMQKVKNFSFSIIYDKEKIEIKNINSSFWKIDFLWEKWNGIETIIIHWDKKSFDLWENLAEISFLKKKDEKSQVNLFNANFLDEKNETYNLTTSWIQL